MLSVVILSVVMLSAVMLSVVMLSVVMLFTWRLLKYHLLNLTGQKLFLTLILWNSFSITVFPFSCAQSNQTFTVVI
jgi:hypothetical protein